MVARTITVVQMLPDLESGGVERGTLELGSYLTARGHRSIVVSGGGRLVGPLEAGGSKHVTWPVGRKNPLSLRYILPLRRLLQAEQVDILHLRSRLPAWLGYLAWKSLPPGQRPRLVTTFHGFYSVNRYSAIMTKGEKVIAISRAVADHIKENYGVADERLTLIYRGFDEKTFDPAAVTAARLGKLQENWGIADWRRPLIVLPARLTRLKGHEVFLRALARIKDLNWTGLCVGSLEENPGYAAELQKMAAELELDRRVKFVGHCDDMAAALLFADLVVSATAGKPEAFGRTAVEAAAMGRAVIASAHGGSLETVLPGQTGWLVPPGEAGSLAGALRQAVVEPQLCERYGEQGKKWVRENFTIRKMCDKTLNLYLGLLEPKSISG